MLHRLIPALALAASVAAQNLRPIIGILTLPNDNPNYKQPSYFPASYVKWLESAGARVVPLLYTQSPSELQAMLKNLNGAFFTGGGADFVNPDGTLTQFAAAAQIIFNESVSAYQRGEVFPLWGTCQGHELISFLAAGPNASVLTAGFDSENYTIPLNFTPAAATSRLYGSIPAQAVDVFATQPVTMNNHQAGVTPDNFYSSAPLYSRFNILSTNVDRNGVPFVSSMEAKDMPIYTTQYHPEKVQFEYRSFPDPNTEAAALIYNYPVSYTGIQGDEFEQCYFFD